VSKGPKPAFAPSSAQLLEVRMTARWSGAAQKVTGASQPHKRAVSMRNVGGFPTALGGQSPKGMFSRVLVT